MARIEELDGLVVVVVNDVVVVDAVVVVVTNAPVVVVGHVYTSHGHPFGHPDYNVN